MLVRRLTLTLFSSNSECKKTTTLYIETKIEERERIDEREAKNEKEKGSGRHVSPLPNISFDYYSFNQYYGMQFYPTIGSGCIPTLWIR
jgi:hypothetical protein